MQMNHFTIIDESNYTEACDKIYGYISEQGGIAELDASNIKDIIANSFISGISYIKFFSLVVDNLKPYI